ncbi:MAG TPA: decaprenyl-phosphate phosphoribosyltransferase [Planctomycetes bacterium]|nr:decaprenyl-phosphate phosphoribosyltransferase [Planctomycetota bacterium]
MLIRDMIQLARPGHWVKNIVVFMPVVFGMRMTHLDAWAQAGVAAAAFCFASAFAYIINDIKDRQSDRRHPLKKFRPLACDKISTQAAIAEATVFLLIGVFLARSLSVILLLIVLLYVLLQTSYTFFLKHKALIDVICIALGFVLRAASGAVAIRVEISPWLFICMFTLCLFMGFCKRYSEVVTIGDADIAQNHRPTLIEYTPELLTHLITLSAGIAVIAFLLYGLSERTVAQFGTHYFIYTLPVAVYAVFRFAMLSMRGAYSGPTELILRDRPFQLTILIWMVLILVAIRFSSNIESWIQSLY